MIRAFFIHWRQLAQLSSLVLTSCLLAIMNLIIRYRKKMLTPLNTHQVSREGRLHIGLDPHPHIVQLYATFEDETNYYLALVRSVLWNDHFGQ